MPSKHFLATVKERLLKEKQSTLQRSSSKHDIDSDGDETDEIQAKIQIESYNTLAVFSQVKLAQIERALEDIEKGSYGICDDCDEPIAEKRLLANPYVMCCISCAEEREAEEKQRKGF